MWNRRWVAGRLSFAMSAEAGREFDKLATDFDNPSRLAYPGSELASQPQSDAPINNFSLPEPSVTQLRQVCAIRISVRQRGAEAFNRLPFTHCRATSFPVAPALSDNRVPASVQNPDRTLVDALVNAPTARSRQAACRGPLIRLPDAAIGVPLLRAAAQAARAARRGPCCARLSAWWALPVVWLKQTPRSVRLVLTLASLGRDWQHNCQAHRPMTRHPSAVRLTA